MEDPTEALWTLRSALDKVYYKPNNNNNGWRLSPGIKIFGPDTKAKCPNCESWITTNRIWLVDEIKAYVKGCWNRDGTKVEGIIHPHIQYNGLICLGDSGGASNALFAGVDRGRHHHSTERWFDQLGHDCPDAIRDTCIGCNLLYFDSELTNSVGCGKCISDKVLTFCDNCHDLSIACEITNGLCETCQIDIYYCPHCGAEVDRDYELCSECECRVCGDEISEDSIRYCSRHLYECACDCECSSRLDEEDKRCDRCIDDCIIDDDDKEE